MCAKCGGSCGGKNKFRFKDDYREIMHKKITPEGFLQAKIYLSREGIQEYSAYEIGLTDRSPNDRVKVYRPSEEVFKQESMDSFIGKPVTDDHPSELLTIDNLKESMGGFVCDKITKENKHTVTMITVTDKDLITKVNSGKKQVSAGYESNIVVGKGITPEGEEYDAMQTDIIGNHVAIVDEGRCGDTCKIQDHSLGEKKMVKIQKMYRIEDTNEYLAIPEGAEELYLAMHNEIARHKSDNAAMKEKLDSMEKSQKDSENIESKSAVSSENGRESRSENRVLNKKTREDVEKPEGEEGGGGRQTREEEGVLNKKDRKDNESMSDEDMEDEGEHSYKETKGGLHKYEADEEESIRNKSEDEDMEDYEKLGSLDANEESIKSYKDYEEVSDEESEDNAGEENEYGNGNKRTHKKDKKDWSFDEDEEIERRAEERSKVTDFARKIIPNFKSKGKKILDIKKEVLAYKNSKIRLDGLDKKTAEAYINGRFDELSINHKDHLKVFDNHLSKITDQQSTADSQTEHLTPREKMRQRNENMYKLNSK